MTKTGGAHEHAVGEDRMAMIVRGLPVGLMGEGGPRFSASALRAVLIESFPTAVLMVKKPVPHFGRGSLGNFLRLGGFAEGAPS